MGWGAISWSNVVINGNVTCSGNLGVGTTASNGIEDLKNISE